MTAATLDAGVALIVVDLQAATAGNPAIQPLDEVVVNAGILATAFRERGLPVVIATVLGTPPGRNSVGSRQMVFPEQGTVGLLPTSSDDILAARSAWSAFAGTDLEAQLRGRDVTQVVIAGIATSFGIESTARAAYDLGFTVLIATDAIKDLNPASHEASLTRVFPILAELATTGEILELL